MRRGCERLIAALLLLGSTPLLALVAVLVRRDLGRSVLFRQERAGLGERPFHIIKFRTMSDSVGPEGVRLADADRITSLGQRLRTSSIDELPQLWNVARGEMAFVGPRPLPLSYLPRYTAREARRHEVLPGITGWAQVCGRNTTPWDERLEMDVWYVEHRSLRLDLKILWRTIRRVRNGEGVGHGDLLTMPELRPGVDEDGWT
jgi:lipopolysaccharide/colanic/teichoic acid biosynthesis glycosyltransferase